MPRPSGLRVEPRRDKATGKTQGFTICGTVAGVRIRRRAQSSDKRLATEEAKSFETQLLRDRWHRDHRAIKRVPSGFNDIPKTAGVYFLIRDNEVVYIGTSANLSDRVKRHRTNGREFDQILFVKIIGKKRFTLEKWLIGIFEPAGNGTRA